MSFMIFRVSVRKILDQPMYIIEAWGGGHYGYFNNHHTEKLNKVTNPKKSWEPHTDLMRQDYIYDVRIT